MKSCIASHNKFSCFEFDQNYFGVSFTPYVKQADNENFYYKSYTFENIKTMLTVVSGKFSNVVVRDTFAIEDGYIENITYHSGSYASVYSGEAAAKINEEKTKKLLTLLYEARVSRFGKESNVDIQLTLEAAEKANKIYPGTVQGVILSAIVTTEIQQTLDHLKAFKRNATKLQLKLGAQLDCIAFLRGDNKELVNLQKIIITESEIISCRMIAFRNQKYGPVATFESMAKVLLAIREEIKSINPNVTVIGNVQWSSSGFTEWETLENMKLYWESFSKWSTAENYMVYLSEAFDNPWRDNPPSSAHVGWWKLNDNLQINSAEGYVEKYAVILDSPAEDFSCSGCFKFDQNHFGVSFTPYVKHTHSGNYHPRYYTYENIKTMLTVVSGKFTRVFVKDSYGLEDGYIGNITYQSASYASVYSGEIAAKINREGGKKILTLLYEVKVFKSAKKSQAEMKLALEAAEKANKIFPGTVEGVILGGNSEVNGVSKMQQILDILKSYKANNTTLQIKVGAELSYLETFMTKNRADYVNLVNLQVDVFAESEIISCQAFVAPNPENGPVASFKSIANGLLFFREIITSVNPNVTVIGNVQWSSSGVMEWESIENLKLFWEYVSKWSAAEKYTVYLKEAFDNPWRNEPPSDAHLGWWKLKDNSRINLVGGYVEKVSASPDNNKMFHGAVIMQPNLLINILKLSAPLYYQYGDYTENFLSTFTQFLIDFDWLNDSNNDVLQMTAEYNQQNIGNDTENALRIWLSFQPRRDITVDLDVIAGAIRTTNAKYPGTVSTVVLNYGSLIFFREEITLVKQDMQLFNSKFKSLANENLRLGLQFHEINCINQAIYTMSLDYSLVDMVFVTPQNKHEDITRVVLKRRFCSFRLNSVAMAAFNTHLTIYIALQQQNYSYNHEMLQDLTENKPFFYKQVPFLMYAEIEEQTSDERIENFTMRADLETWLQQESKFNGLHFGAWHEINKPNPNVEAVRNTIGSLNLHKILLSTESTAVGDESEVLQRLLTELMQDKVAEQGRTKGADDWNKDNSLEVFLLVTLEDKELELNKRKIERTVSAAADANAKISGTVTTIIFDWMVCKNTSSGCSELQEANECWIQDKFYDTFRLLNYTREIMANKTQMKGSGKAFNLIIMADADFWGKVHIAKPSCRQLGKVQRIADEYDEMKLKYICQSICFMGDVLKIGAKRMSVNIVENFTRCMSPIVSIEDVSYYLKITGCNGGEHADIIRQLTEYVDLVERMNKWAEYVNRTVFVNMGIEDTEACGRWVDTAQKSECTCGWWIQTKTSEDGPNYTLQNKKSRVLQILQRTRNASSPTHSPPHPNPSAKSSISTEMLLMIFIPVLLFAVLISSLTVFLVIHYKSKDAMSKQEVANFFKGKRRQRIVYHVASETVENDNSAESEPYNVEKYELTPSSFTIDRSSTLGSGEFGKVHRGSIKLQGGTVETAVKVTSTPEFGKSHGFYMSLKGLISEIKILSYVGQHKHVVSFLGAYTAKLRKGDIAVFLEYCPLGSLDKYLRAIVPHQGISSNDQGLTSSVCSTRQYVNTCVKNLLDNEMVDLMSKWPREIACGMEFLTSKKIVHADLATRNILLTAEKVAKIADFGLSRRLYDYSEYIKRNQGPLPWRWMAPEALRRMVFNEKTDVWAFGVTLWEIFSLGDEPYSGLNWHVNFPSMLARGLVLPEPKHDTMDIYLVMMRCWSISPALRPTFAQLSSELSTTTPESGEHSDN